MFILSNFFTLSQFLETSFLLLLFDLSVYLILEKLFNFCQATFSELIEAVIVIKLNEKYDKLFPKQLYLLVLD